MENFADGGARAGMRQARAQGVRAADGGASEPREAGAAVAGRGLGYQGAPVPAPSYSLGGGMATVAAGGGAGTVAEGDRLRLGCPGPPVDAGTVVAGVPVPPSQPPPPGGGRWPLVGHMAYGPLRDSVPTARGWAKAVLREWGSGPGGWLGDAAMVVTELVTNAVNASCALAEVRPVRVWLCRDRVRLLVEVGDESLAVPVRCPPSDEALSGRGLQVVARLSSGWGWFPATAHGLAKVVWADLHMPGA